MGNRLELRGKKDKLFVCGRQSNFIVTDDSEINLEGRKELHEDTGLRA